MLHLLSFIWLCLLLAALAGALLAYWWWGRKFGAQKAQDTSLAKDLETTKRTVLEQTKQLETLKIEHNKQQEALKAELTTVKNERDLVRTETIPLNTRIDELTRNLDALQKQAATPNTAPKTLGELEAIGAERDQLKIALAKAQEQVSAHTQALAQANTNIQTANTTIQAAQLQLQAQETRIREQAAELSRVRTEAAPLSTAEPVSTATGLTIPPAEPGHDDDLKEIVGVGPFIESKLHALGIRTFKQITLLSPAMLEQVAEHIEHFQGRIGRENWSEQCKALHFDKYGEKL